MNEYQKSRFVLRIIKALFNTVSAKKIAILGFAFKKDTGDTRETPALSVVNGLLEEGAQVAIYDPIVEKSTIERDLQKELHRPKDAIEWCESVIEAARGAHALVICTEWDEFKTLPYEKLFEIMEKPAHLFDGRLVVDVERLRGIGFRVHSIGKSDEAETAIVKGSTLPL